MASKYWIKLYHEILDDPKMGKLPDNLWRRAIELFLLAGELDNEGHLPGTEEIAWKLRLTSNETLQKELLALQQCNIVTQIDNGNWFVVHFSERQEAIDVNERVKKFRERQRRKDEKTPKKPPVEEPKEDVTKRYTDIDIDIDIDKDKELDSQPKVSAEPPKKKKDECAADAALMPDTPIAIKFFEMLTVEFTARGRRPPKKFPSVACKRKFNARAEYLGSSTEHGISRAFEKGIMDIPGITDFIAKWDPKNQPPKNGAYTNGQYNQHTKPLQRTGESLDSRPTVNPYTGEIVPASVS